LSFSHRPPEQFSGRIVEAEPIGNPIKLGLGQVKRVKRLVAHNTVPFPIKKMTADRWIRVFDNPSFKEIPRAILNVKATFMGQKRLYHGRPAGTMRPRLFY
jgi:hypothetical protein